MADFYRTQFGPGGTRMEGSVGSAGGLVKSQLAGPTWRYVHGASPNPFNRYPQGGLTGATRAIGSDPASRSVMNQQATWQKRRMQQRVWTARGESFARGTIGAGRFAGRVGIGAARLGFRAATSAPARAGMKATYGALNAGTMRIFGGSIPQIATMAGIGLAAYGLLSDRPVESAQRAGSAISAMGEQLAMSKRPRYGTTVFQQSVQGLTFGLHSRRNG